MDRAKDVRWIIPFKKFGMIRVNGHLSALIQKSRGNSSRSRGRCLVIQESLLLDWLPRYVEIGVKPQTNKLYLLVSILASRILNILDKTVNTMFITCSNKFFHVSLN